MTCLWYGPFHTRPVTVMLIRKPARSEGFDVAIASTDRRHHGRADRPL